MAGGCFVARGERKNQRKGRRRSGKGEASGNTNFGSIILFRLFEGHSEFQVVIIGRGGVPFFLHANLVFLHNSFSLFSGLQNLFGAHAPEVFPTSIDDGSRATSSKKKTQKEKPKTSFF